MEPDRHDDYYARQLAHRWEMFNLFPWERLPKPRSRIRYLATAAIFIVFAAFTRQTWMQGEPLGVSHEMDLAVAGQGTDPSAR